MAEKKINLGNKGLTELWNLNPDNLEACRAAERDFLPSVENYFEEAIELGYARKREKKPIYNESLLAGTPLKPRKKPKNIGDQVGRKEKEKFEQTRYELRPPWSEQKEEEVRFKQVQNYRFKGTGQYKPPVWKVQYEESMHARRQMQVPLPSGILEGNNP